MTADRIGPLSGVAFVAIAIVSFAIGGEPKSADEPVQEVVDWYKDNKDSVQIGALLTGVAMLFLVWWGGNLRRVLRAAEGEGGVLSAVVLIATAIIGIGFTIDATIAFAIAERVDDIDPTAVQAMQALWDSDFLPIALGVTLFLFSTGISIVRHGAFPKWMGWVLIVGGLFSFTPLFFVGGIIAALFTVVASVMLSLRAGEPAAGPTAP
jgi:hypothetical protein